MIYYYIYCIQDIYISLISYDKSNLLRSHIEKNQIDLFKSKVLSNPRYLISAGDAPVIFQVIELFPFKHVNNLQS